LLKMAASPVAAPREICKKRRRVVAAEAPAVRWAICSSVIGPSFASRLDGVVPGPLTPPSSPELSALHASGGVDPFDFLLGPRHGFFGRCSLDRFGEHNGNDREELHELLRWLDIFRELPDAKLRINVVVCCPLGPAGMSWK
jgi:hypothetical protein